MEEELGILLVGVTSTLESLAVELSKTTEVMSLIANKFIELRTDVNKLIENQTGGTQNDRP